MMHPVARSFRSCVMVLLTLTIPTTAIGQSLSAEEFVTGSTAAAWEKWQTAIKAVLSRDSAAAEAALAELAAAEPSPLRLALFAERSIHRTAEGGGVLLLEQDYAANALGENGRKIAEMLEAGREQMNQADDGWYFSSLGRFDVAEANFRALIDSDPDPIALLEFADRVSRRHELLVQLSDNPVVGDSVRTLIRTLARGEQLIKADPVRIKQNIERLGGSPRAFENASAALRDSGEYAVPFLVQHLRKIGQSALMQPLLRALTQIDRAALNPLVYALRMNDQTTKKYLIEVLGNIGYAQAVPYLLAVRDDPQAPSEVRSAVEGALRRLEGRGMRIPDNFTVADAFFDLAEQYYRDSGTLRADTTLDFANVWYWRDDLLQNVEVPTVIFNEIMTMRCCEEALRTNPNHRGALALWIAANLRREAQVPPDAKDVTRPANYPSPVYFARSAGPEYCLDVLARAIEDNDPVVARGAIEGLRNTAGPVHLIADQSGRLPLAEALTFPNQLIRIHAAITLGSGMPTTQFAGYQNLMPVLSEALRIHGGARNALVVDVESESANAIAGTLRGMGYNVLIDSRLVTGLDKARRDTPGVDLIVLGSDLREPPLEPALLELRNEFRFAAVPVLIIAKPANREVVRNLVRNDPRLGQTVIGEPAELVTRTIERISKATGVETVTPEMGSALAIWSARALRGLALTNNPVFNVADAESALVGALASQNEVLRDTVADVLGYLGTPASQTALAERALGDTDPVEVRKTMFAALAEAAKRRGNHLSDAQVQRLIKIVESDANLELRESASRALGALNLPGNPASTIVRNQYGG